MRYLPIDVIPKEFKEAWKKDKELTTWERIKCFFLHGYKPIWFFPYRRCRTCGKIIQRF